MCITDEKLVDAYGKGDPLERFMLIYRNYEVFPQLIDCYELGLFNRILYEKEYNRRKKNGDDLTSTFRNICPRRNASASLFPF